MKPVRMFSRRREGCGDAVAPAAVQGVLCGADPLAGALMG
jgi:hypothetical protein